MDRKTRVSIIVAAAVVVAYPVVAWLLGLAAEWQSRQREQQFLERYPYVVLIKRDYHRGLYSATEELTYGLGGSFAKRLGAMPGGKDWSSYRITVRNTIHHGPLPQLRGFAPATADTELVLPPEVRRQLDSALGGKANLLVHTRMGWLGGSSTSIKSAAFEQQLPSGTVVTSRGLSGTIDSSRDLTSASVNFSAPGFELKSAVARAGFEKVSLNADLQRAFDLINVGTADMKVARFHLEPTAPGGRKVSLQGFSFDSASSVKADYVDMGGGIKADALEAGEFSASHVAYEFRFDHVHGPSLAAFSKTVQSNAREGTSVELSAQNIQNALKTSGVELLLRDPVFEISRIGFAMPEGELLLTAKVTAPGLKREELEGSPAAIRVALVQHLKASADLRIDAALAEKLLDSAGKRAAFAPQLERLEHQGYIKRDGKALTTHLTFDGGRLLVNGQPFPPTAP
jgi:uncharacterized protein YdgA (DUF945 family)